MAKTRSYPRALAAMLTSSPGDALSFLADVLRALPNGSRLRSELHAWRETVEAWRDPELVASLTAPFDEADYVEVVRPASSP